MSIIFFCYAYRLFLEQFFVAQYNPLVRFDPACRSGARHSDKWPALSKWYILMQSEGKIKEGSIYPLWHN